MKKIVKSAVAGIILASSALLGAQSALAQSALANVTKSGELKVCFDAGYVPFEMKAKDGRFIGFDIDLMKQMANAMKVKFVPVNTAWDGIIPALQTNKCDIIAGGMTITAERNLKVLFADPYIVIGQSILLSPKLADKVKTYKDLNNPKYSVTTKLGTTGAEAIKKFMPKAKLSLFDTEADAVMQVTNGNADAYIYDFPYNAIYAAQHKGMIVHLDKPFTFEPLAWAIRQDDPDFLNFLNNYLRQIKGDGTYDRIYNKWFKTTGWLKEIQ